MDLSKLDMNEAASRGAEMVLRHPSSGEELFTDDEPIIFQLLGSDSAEYRQRIRAAANKSINKGRRTQTVERLEQESIDLLAGVTVDWSGVVVDGEAVEFSHNAAKKLYTEYAWIREQVDEFVGERSNFLSNA